MKRVSIFEELDEDDISLPGQLFEEVSFQTGTIIFRQGQAAKFLYLVINGTVDISFKPFDGTPMIVSHIGKYGLFGWSAVIGSEKYTSSAIAIEAVKALRLRGRELREFCVQHPQAGEALLERLATGVSSRWQDAHKQVKSILIQGLKN